MNENIKRNAVIMAAGLASRFAPLSYETPKALLPVKGEILIERQIRQLQEAGVEEIIVVVGYMREKFDYLKDKYNVRVIYNKDYYKYNNTSSLFLALDYFNNTYICSADNYFKTNPFIEDINEAYYSVQPTNGQTNEYFTELDANKYIIDLNFEDGKYFMIGHAFFTKNISKKFKEILRENYIRKDVKEMLWENLYYEYINKLRLKAKIDYNLNIYEFDTFDELRSFDEYYINYPSNTMLNNISNYFKVPVSEIRNINELVEGLTNLSFKFEIQEIAYVYRHPGEGTEAIINRKAEFAAQTIAKKLKLDESFIYMDKEKGYKISNYLNECRILDYQNENDLKLAMKNIRKLHDSKIKTDFDSNLWSKTNEMLVDINQNVRSQYNDFEKLYENLKEIYTKTNNNSKDKYLCHCDFFNTNILFHEEKIYIIDWEYAGNDDPAADLGIFVASSNLNIKQAINLLDIYEGKKMENKKATHFISYYAIASYYCFIWAVYQESKGQSTDGMLEIWYENTLKYIDLTNEYKKI